MKQIYTKPTSGIKIQQKVLSNAKFFFLIIFTHNTLTLCHKLSEQTCMTIQFDIELFELYVCKPVRGYVLSDSRDERRKGFFPAVKFDGFNALDDLVHNPNPPVC